jgi:hypothetical protein
VERLEEVMRGRIPILLLVGCGLLSACAKPVTKTVLLPVPAPPVVETVTPVTVVSTPRRTTTAPPVVDHCPTAAEIRRLRAARPKPLRAQPMPASPAERVARTSAQLGLYEAHGAWADQVEEAFARCDPS